MKTIYIEKSIIHHPRVKQILERIGNKNSPIICDNYRELFNHRSQNFRLQKQQPALILAYKYGNRVLPTPAGLGIGNTDNYYFSHMLNCLYDCRYCFLQGMYQSAHHVLFVNYEDFMPHISQIAKITKNVTFFTGYDCDSLAYEPISYFLETFLPFFASLPQAIFELRTKSVNIRPLLKQSPLRNVVTAFSFTPKLISQTVELGVPAFEKRINALAKIANHGWPIGLRFDPLIWQDDMEHHYATMIDDIFAKINANNLHSISIGPLRFPTKMYKNIVKIYPDDKLLAHPLHQRQNHFSYTVSKEQKMKNFVTSYLKRYISKKNIYSCSSL